MQQRLQLLGSRRYKGGDERRMQFVLVERGVVQVTAVGMEVSGVVSHVQTV
jgi:hypothetical protein